MWIVNIILLIFICILIPFFGMSVSLRRLYKLRLCKPSKLQFSFRPNHWADNDCCCRPAGIRPEKVPHPQKMEKLHFSVVFHLNAFVGKSKSHRKPREWRGVEGGWSRERKSKSCSSLWGCRMRGAFYPSNLSGAKLCSVVTTVTSISQYLHSGFIVWFTSVEQPHEGPALFTFTDKYFCSCLGLSQ